MDDSFIRDYIEELLKNIRTQVLIKLIKPYTRVEIAFIAKELNITSGEVENLLIALILDNKVNGLIDQVHQRLELVAEYASILPFHISGRTPLTHSSFLCPLSFQGI